MRGGRADYRGSPRGESGRMLCRWCRVEVPKGRRTFCSGGCVHHWRLRTDPGYLRDQVFARDRGICSRCHMDTRTAYAMLKKSRGAQRKMMMGYWGLTRIHRRSLWDADHIVPVIEGGGECDLSNIRTLCIACHKDATAELRSRMANIGTIISLEVSSSRP